MKKQNIPAHRRRLLLAAALIALGAPLAAASGPTAAPIFPDMAHTVGDDPVAVAIGDLDGDGRRDLVVANRWSEDLSVLLGRGDGDFAPERRFDASGIPVALVVADFNRDGRDDVAVARPVDDRVVLYLAQPAGTLVPSLTLTAGDSPSALLAADLDGDGLVDLAVANYFSDDVLLFAGRGDGSFAAARAFPVGNRPAALVVGLFDADLRADLAVANEGSGDVTILLGDVAMGFRHGGDFSTWAPGWHAAPRRVVAADFDGDGALDLVAGNFDNVDELNSLVLLPGQGDGSFAAGRFVARAADGLLALVAADFNRDGRPDLAFGAHHGATCCDLRNGSILLGRGDFGFDAGGGYRSGRGPVAAAIGFFDADAVVDLAVISDAGWDEVAINLGSGDGTMGSVPALLDPGIAPSDVALGDPDGDGRLDIVGLEMFSGRLSVLRSDGGGQFAAPLVSTTGRAARSFVLGDFNGDGLDDAAVLAATEDEIVLFTATGGGSLGNPTVLRPGFALRALAAADVTGDGIDDLLVASADGGVVILLDAPGSGARPPVRLPAGSDDPRALVAADINGDGLVDIVVAGQSLAVLPAVTPGQFGLPLIAATYVEFSARLLAGDIDHDGRADIVVAGEDLLFYAGRPDGGLEPGIGIGPRTFPAGVALGDTNADGVLDLLVLDDNIDGADLSILPGGTAIPARPSGRVLLATSGRALAAADLDGDGRTDLVIADQWNGIVLVLNQGPFANRPPRALPQAAAAVECSGPAGALVRLDGRSSSDPDSAPGTQDDLAGFTWYEGEAPPGGGHLLAQGSVADVMLPLGTHALTLVVTDRAGATAAQGFVLEVVDTTAPTASARVSPGTLGLPNHRMVAVRAEVSGADLCGAVNVILLSVTSSEPDDAPGIGDGATVGDIQEADPGSADYDLLLRAERDGRGTGRVYTLTYRVTDGAGNATLATTQVMVPHFAAGRGSAGGPGGGSGPGRPRASRGKSTSPLAP